MLKYARLQWIWRHFVEAHGRVSVRATIHCVAVNRNIFQCRHRNVKRGDTIVRRVQRSVPIKK